MRGHHGFFGYHHHHSAGGYLLMLLIEVVVDLAVDAKNSKKTRSIRSYRQRSHNPFSEKRKRLETSSKSKLISEYEKEITSSRNELLKKAEISSFVMSPNLRLPIVQFTLYVLNYVYVNDDDTMDDNEKEQLQQFIDDERSKMSKNTYNSLKRLHLERIQFNDIVEVIRRHKIPLKVIVHALDSVSIYLNYNMKYLAVMKGLYQKLSSI